jgi:predicted O-methyltransferase YrrM
LPNFYQYTSFLKHRTKAKTMHGTHSPFVYQLLEEVIYKKGSYYNYDKVATLRSKLLRDKRTIKVIDLGAGSKKLNNHRKINQIARVSVKNKKLGELIYRLAVNFQPTISLELGTSLGVTTSYLALANTNGHVISLEGDPETRKIALENFHSLNITNIKCIEGNFDTELPKLVDHLTEIDFAFLDGNHRKEPTLNYLKQILPQLKNGSCVIVDDIYWSREMTEAWEEIIKMPEFTVSIDLFHLGILFIRKEQKKEHFIIKF